MKKNVLKSFLFVSLGLIMTIVFTSARMSTTVPDAPGEPIVVKMQKDKCKIEYRAPYNNGGSPIIGYFIEMKRDIDRRWTQVNKEATDQLEYTIDNLMEGSRVQFRVIAINAVGESPASVACDPITVRDH